VRNPRLAAAVCDEELQAELSRKIPKTKRTLPKIRLRKKVPKRNPPPLVTLVELGSGSVRSDKGKAPQGAFLSL
jgi:hypothetical protein